MTAYTSSAAITAQGATFSWAATAVGEIINFKGPGGTTSIIDVSNLSSTYKEKRSGLPDEGTITLTLNLLPADAGQVALRASRTARTVGAALITLNDKGTTSPTTLAFNAFCTGFNIDGAVNAKMTANVTLDITGAVTWTPAV